MMDESSWEDLRSLNDISYANTNSNSAAAWLTDHIGLHETTFKPLSVGPRMVDDDFFGQSLV